MGERIAYYRHLAGLNVTELAKKAKVSVSMVSAIESDKRQPSIDTLRVLHKVLEMDLHWVITGEE